MTTQTWLATAQQQLEAAGIMTARLDALVLLEDQLGRDRTLLLAHPEVELASDDLKSLQDQLRRRYNHEPLAYIRSRSEFFGRDFHINNHVLEPRPESETMISLLKTSDLITSTERSVQVGDIGTGSGCLGITAALELSLTSVGLHDIDPEALRIARRNAERYQVNVSIIQDDLLGEHDYDIILANLPYVPDDFIINTAAGHEPRLAIFGGPDGLDLYRRLFEQAATRPQPPQHIFTEALPQQHPELTKIAATHDYVLMRSDDFIQVFTRP